MSLQPISSLFRIQPAFLRSVDVAEDYDDPHSSKHYVVTTLVRETLRRVSSGLQKFSSQRAWRLTGDYGTGKSSFALAFARVSAGANDRLPIDLQTEPVDRVKLEPVLVTGDLESLTASIVRGIRDTEVRVFGENTSNIASIRATDDILDLLDQLGDRIRAEKIADGLLLVLDELGQNLRYAAQHPDEDDIFLLQRLGEKAARSNGKPLMVLVLLHQGLASYSAAADAVVKKEWEKVAGRYEEIVFVQPVEQTAVLLAETLGLQQDLIPASIDKLMRDVMRRSLSIGVYGSLAAEESLLSLAPRMFPLNPLVLPVLVGLLRKFGQNERSIVSFLTSFEPFGLRAFAEQTTIGDEALYRISDLYDYFRANLSQLPSGPSRARWVIAESIVDQGAVYGEAAERILKAAAILNMIDDPALPSTRDVLLASEVGEEVARTIERLVSELRLLHERGTAKSLSLWPHTSANLDELLRKADEDLGASNPHISTLLNYLPEKQIVARRHYVETGNLRHFSVRYGFSKDAEKILLEAAEQPHADGLMVVLIPFSLDEQREMLAASTIKTLPKHVVCGISAPVAGISDLLSELRRWEWVRKNARELSYDHFASEYVREEIERLKASLRREVAFLIDFVVDHKRPISWFHFGEEVQVDPYRGIASYLSTVCDNVYDVCPKVRNELINRRVTSSAASRARTVLIEALATRSTEDCLGFDDTRNPPELAIYLSVLKEGMLHVADGDQWRFARFSELVEDPCRLAPSLRRIHELLLNADLDRVPVDRIYEDLRRPGYGVLDGLLPLLVSVYLAAHWQETSVYEDGTFLLKVGGNEFQRLNKEPEAFALQHCSVSGIRLEVYDQLCKALGTEVNQQPDVLTVVRPLVSFAVSLPEYVRNTREVISPRARKVRDLLLTSGQPSKLLFKELPEALGFPVVQGERFVDADIASFIESLSETLAELRNAYPALLLRIRDGLQDAFKFTGQAADFRRLLGTKAAVIASHIHDLDFKAFVLRVGDTALPDTQWVESVATLVAKKAPERWGNTDEAIFFENLGTLMARLLRVESIYFDTAVAFRENPERCMRVTVTRADGAETQEIVNWGPDDDQRLESARDAMRGLLLQHGRLAIVAAGLLCQQEEVVQNERRTV